MSLQPSEYPIDRLPEDTQRVAEAAFPRGNDSLRLRDELGPLFRDADFADLYSHRGKPAYSPARLALVAAKQDMENYSDQQAAEAMRAALNELARESPEFVCAVAEPPWLGRYGQRAKQTRLPSS